MNVIMYGTPIAGLGLVGPFDTPEDACEWAEDNCNEEWWLVRVEAPEEIV